LDGGATWSIPVTPSSVYFSSETSAQVVINGYEELGSRYHLRVSAVNVVGTGPPSSTFEYCPNVAGSSCGS
jgi:hypothetical protein